MLQKAILVIGGLVALVTGLVAYHWSEPDFSTLDGEAVSWSELQGQVVVINFFAEWCAPCLRELPELNRFAGMIEGQNVRLFGASFDQVNNDELSKLKEKYQIGFDLILSQPPARLPLERPNALPATFIIGPDGRVLRQLMGEQHADSLLDTVLEFL
ncbi:peroxiredoxin family protein [Bowmanella dokdonensis]|uniref:TlpA family protein disulfide reductase n=1 Tax=Bowmanella dokdonensis TaxID=751969 RepID=A0A939DMB2_9ALTE|nr:TlpA disulfide reductase family protein [Bowmanella dokdonensis]MBN7824411.1 TlpA family protein disulfide reductase [Bowmanella dokdonensis]